MSHYITASFGENVEKGAVLSYGVSWRTLSALQSSGIDIYALYEGVGHDGGMSGDGTTVKVAPEQCEYAYRQVIAWVVAMQECHPEAYQKEYGEASPYNSDRETEAQKIDSIIDNQPFPVAEIEQISQEFYDDLNRYPLNVDRLDRSMGYLSPVLHFARSIYEFTSKTHQEVHVGFY